jgi:hypothetical protein
VAFPIEAKFTQLTSRSNVSNLCLQRNLFDLLHEGTRQGLILPVGIRLSMSARDFDVALLSWSAHPQQFLAFLI